MKKLVVYKHSKLEWDAHQTGLTRAQLIARYKEQGANVDAIVKADEHQCKVRQWFNEYFPNDPSKGLEEFTLVGPGNADLVISIGGDNSFTRVSQFCTSNNILGINSDPDRSVGHLLDASVRTKKDVKKIADKLAAHEYSVQEWQRLFCKINGRPIRLATSELFLGEKLRKNMSRHILERSLRHPEIRRPEGRQKLGPVEHKCSGLIIATGAGSTGWLRSASQWMSWNPELAEFRYMATEPFGCVRQDDWVKYSECIYPEDYLKITSLNDDGIVSVDSWEEWSFNRGSVAEISFGLPLKVIHLNVDKPKEKK